MKTIKYRIKTSAFIGDWQYLYLPNVPNNKEDMDEEVKDYFSSLIESDIRSKNGDIHELEGYRGFDWDLADDMPKEWIDKELESTQRKLSYYKDKLLFLKDRRYFNSIDPVNKL